MPLTRLTTIAPQKAAQKPAMLEAGQQPAGEREHSGVQDEQKQSEGDHRDRKGQDHREWPHEGIDEPQHDGCAKQPPRAVEADAVNEAVGRPEADSRNQRLTRNRSMRVAPSLE
ncbi:MAG: hypothetical protein MZV49_08775 [Rhodopseudomonas palustris]|nr:hypothetical protein [Rhodopseudomonas palustris]